MEQENKAAKALRGEKQPIHFGEWVDMKEKKIVVFEGQQSSSACHVYNSEGGLRVSVIGNRNEELIVFVGERVYAQAANIQFKPASD